MYVTIDVTFSESEMYYPSDSSNPHPQGETRHDENDWTINDTIDLPLPLAEPIAAALPA